MMSADAESFGPSLLRAGLADLEVVVDERGVVAALVSRLTQQAQDTTTNGHQH